MHSSLPGVLMMFMLIEAPNAGDANTAGLSSVWSHDDIISQERTGDQTEEPLMEFYHHGAAQMPTNWNDPSMTTGTVMFWGWNSFVWYISIWHFWYVECWVCLRGNLPLILLQSTCVVELLYSQDPNGKLKVCLGVGPCSWSMATQADDNRTKRENIMWTHCIYMMYM